MELATEKGLRDMESRFVNLILGLQAARRRRAGAAPPDQMMMAEWSAIRGAMRQFVLPWRPNIPERTNLWCRERNTGGDVSRWVYNPVIDRIRRDETDEEIVCVICHTNPPGIRFFPCSHKVVCICCFKPLEDHTKRDQYMECPVCRSRITRIDRDTDPAPYKRQKIGDA